MDWSHGTHQSGRRKAHRSHTPRILKLRQKDLPQSTHVQIPIELRRRIPELLYSATQAISADVVNL